jgi:hypothetical protein
LVVHVAQDQLLRLDRVALAQVLDEQAVVAPRGAALREIGEQHVAPAGGELVERVQHAHQHRVVRRLDQADVEFGVECGDVAFVREHAVGAREDVVEPVQVVVGAALAGQVDRQQFEVRAHLHRFGHLAAARRRTHARQHHERLEAAVLGEVAQVDAGVGPRLDDAQRDQRRDRLAQRVAADAEPLGEVALRRQPVAGLQPALLQVAEDASDHRMAGRAVRLVRGGCRSAHGHRVS